MKAVKRFLRYRLKVGFSDNTNGRTGVTHGGGKFVAVAASGTGNRVMTATVI